MFKLTVTLLFSLLHFSLFSQQTYSIEGRVLGIDSLPIDKASVRLLNTEKGVITDTSGVFKISAVLPGNYQMELSAVGYTQRVLHVNVVEGIQKQKDYYLVLSLNYLDEIVVSSEKLEQKIQKIPVAVSAFTKKDISEFRIWNLNEISGLVPNLYSSNPGDNRNVTSIRGIGTTSYDPAIATYVDGVNQFNLDTYIPQLTDVERIEVLRGPQGTLYGRNAMGGVINVITKKPVNKTDAFVELNVGNFSQQRYTGGFKTPLIAGKLFAGVALQYQSRDGYFTNLYTNDDFDRQSTITGNYYLKYLPSEKWSLTANIKHVNNENNGAFTLAPDKETAFNQPYIINQNALATMQDDIFNANLSVNYYGKSFNFSSQTAYQSNYRIYDNPLDGDFSPLDIISIFNYYGNKYNKVSAWTEEFKFSNPTNHEGPLSWTAGGFFFFQDNPVKQATVFGSQAPLIGFPDSNFSFITINDGSSKGLAFFGQGNYSVSKKLSITVGLRYDYESKKLGIEGQYLKEPNPPFTVVPDTASENSYSAFSPKLGLTYTISENQLLYFSYSRGFRTGGLTPLSTDPSQTPLYSYDPEFSDNIEAGWKNTWYDNRLKLNLTAFITKVSDAQVPTLILPDAITVIQNAGTLLSKGFELEIDSRPIKRLELKYNFGYTNAEYTELILSQNGQELNLDGNKQIFTPSSTSMLVVQYSFPLKFKKPVNLIARGEWIHMGNQFFDLANTIEQESYSLLNARLGVNMKRFDVFFWGRNLGKEKYIAYAYDFGAVHLGDPQTYGITVSVRF